jgi:hypothetical protein
MQQTVTSFISTFEGFFWTPGHSYLNIIQVADFNNSEEFLDASLIFCVVIIVPDSYPGFTFDLTIFK